MGPENGINLTRVNYFSLAEYVDRIRLCDDIFYHVEDTSKSFESYIKFLSAYDYDIIIKHLIDSFTTEIQYSNLVERHLVRPEEINKNNVFFDSLAMSHQRIKQLHEFAHGKNPNFRYDYRESLARRSWIDKNTGEEHIYWYGAEPEDIKKFMDDYIKFYKTKGIQIMDISPFLKAALCHLLFVRIHPFNDGNSRTSRLLYDMKFTEMINKLYGTNLKISPLHLSMSIYVNQPTYARKIRDIYFDVEHDCNDEINRFIDFLLNMTDEQLHYMMTDDSKRALDELLIGDVNREAFNIHAEEEKIKEAESMKLKKIFKG
jgi:Fic family protein